MTTFIDIHPHIIASDTARYPLAPLGGHQSDWSRTRPVTTEQMIAAMDKAGVAKAAIAYKAAYGPVAGTILPVDTPGLTAVNPARLTYRRVRRPLWPLT